MTETADLIASIQEMASRVNAEFVPDPQKVAVFEAAQAQVRGLLPGSKRKTVRRQRHAMKRAMERHQLELTEGDVATMSAAIRAGAGVTVSVNARRHSRVVLVRTPAGRQLTVVYSDAQGCIRTVLPAQNRYLRRLKLCSDQ